jgi:hypothetical protein
LRFAGLALGLAAGGVLIALMWPDMMNDLYGAKSLQHWVGMFVMGVALVFLINWPFGWIADKLSAGSGNAADRADIGSSR